MVRLTRNNTCSRLGSSGCSTYGSYGGGFAGVSRGVGSSDSNVRRNQSSSPGSANPTGTLPSKFGLCKRLLARACAFVASKGIKNIVGKPKPSMPKLPGGVTNSQFGKAAGFGRGLKDLPKYTRKQLRAQIRELRELGLTRSDIAKQRNFYKDHYQWSVAEHAETGRAINVSALHRAQHLSRIHSMMTFGF